MNDSPGDLAGAAATYPALLYRSGRTHRAQDALAVEEPLDIRVAEPGGDFTLSLTMRTPGHDRELVTGWLHAEGLLSAVGATEQRSDTPNVLTLRGDAQALRTQARAHVTSAACGVCGSGSVERLSVRAPEPHWDAPPLTPQTVLALPDTLRGAQRGFELTGGLHAAGLFTPAGELLCLREDVGRHNAVDKVVGWAALRGALPLRNAVLVTSSRAGFEIVQKAAVAGAAVVVTVGAASSLATDTALALNLTLVGFTRQGRFNVYAGEHRLALGALS